MPIDNEIKSLMDVIQVAVVASKSTPPKMPRSAAHSDKDRDEWQKTVDAHSAKQEELGEAVVQSAFLLGGLFLSDVRRIADAMEILAKQATDDNLFRGK